MDGVLGFERIVPTCQIIILRCLSKCSECITHRGTVYKGQERPSRWGIIYKRPRPQREADRGETSDREVCCNVCTSPSMEERILAIMAARS